MFSFLQNDRFAVFIDGSNLHATTKALNFDLDYSKLLQLFKDSGRLLRAYYYTALPDGTDYNPIRKLADWLDYNGYTMVTKQTREFTDHITGRKRIKGNMDMELALDMLKIAPHVDHVLLFSGDGDFCRLVDEVQNLGIRVTVVSSVKTRPPLLADVLRRQADDFIDLVELQSFISRPERPPLEIDHDDDLHHLGHAGATDGGAEVLEDNRS
ncbi:MAG: NYN domain-containing protein [Alphaproteobacteria bacterium]|nr:NYN domain-containing protein [Alphaproteobacteria bacterium]